MPPWRRFSLLNGYEIEASVEEQELMMLHLAAGQLSTGRNSVIGFGTRYTQKNRITIVGDHHEKTYRTLPRRRRGFWFFGLRTATTQEKLPAGKIVKVEARPDKIDLNMPFDYRQLLVTGILDNGDRVDLTRLAKISIPDKVVKVSEHGQVRPGRRWRWRIEVHVAGQKGRIPVKVCGLKDEHRSQLRPRRHAVMSRIGCNAGTCHGRARARTASSSPCAATIRCSIIAR